MTKKVVRKALHKTSLHWHLIVDDDGQNDEINIDATYPLNKSLCGSFMYPNDLTDKQLLDWTPTLMCQNCFYSKIANIAKDAFRHPRFLTVNPSPHQWRRFSNDCVDASTTRISLKYHAAVALAKYYGVICEDGRIRGVTPEVPDAMPIIEIFDAKNVSRAIIVNMIEDEMVYYPLRIHRLNRFHRLYNVELQLNQVDLMTISGAVQSALREPEYFIKGVEV